MLIGQYDGKIGEKRQVAFPKRFREVLGDTLIVTKGFENCLIVVSQDRWKTLLEGTEGKPFTSKNTREMQRFLLGNASVVELDAKGRFVLPEYLLQYAHITEEIIYAGIERFVEIWDKNSWEEHQKNLSQSIESIAEKLSNNPAQERSEHLNE
jgi:MraZ protein